MVNKLNNLIMDKKMYKKPETETISVKIASTICASVGFGSGKGTGPALAPKRQEEKAF